MMRLTETQSISYDAQLFDYFELYIIVRKVSTLRRKASSNKRVYIIFVIWYLLAFIVIILQGRFFLCSMVFP